MLERVGGSNFFSGGELQKLQVRTKFGNVILKNSLQLLPPDVIF